MSRGIKEGENKKKVGIRGNLRVGMSRGIK